MLKKINRFHGHNSLNAVYKMGQGFNESQINLRTIPARPGRKHRVAVVVSKKVDKSAVARNRIRRRVYESVRLLSPNFINQSDIVINIYSPQIATMPQDELTKSLISLFNKAGLITESNAELRDIVDRQKE